MSEPHIQKFCEVEVVLNGPEWLIVELGGLQCRPEDVLAWFLEPESLARWWGNTHTIEPRVGGIYEIGWPQIGRTLRGQIVELTDQRLSYSWWFTHEPETPPRVAIITSLQTSDSTGVRIHHGPYRRDDSDAEERQGHLEGWQYFLPLLAAAMTDK